MGEMTKLRFILIPKRIKADEDNFCGTQFGVT